MCLISSSRGGSRDGYQKGGTLHIYRRHPTCYKSRCRCQLEIRGCIISKYTHVSFTYSTNKSFLYMKIMPVPISETRKVALWYLFSTPASNSPCQKPEHLRHDDLQVPRKKTYHLLNGRLFAPNLGPPPLARLCLTIVSAAAAAASRSFCRLLSLKYGAASGRILKILNIISSLGSACASFLFSSFAFFIVPRLRLSIMLFVLRIEVEPIRPPKEAPRLAGAERRFRCACAR